MPICRDFHFLVYVLENVCLWLEPGDLCFPPHVSFLTRPSVLQEDRAGCVRAAHRVVLGCQASCHDRRAVSLEAHLPPQPVLTVCPLLPSGGRDPQGADLRGEAGRMQRGHQCQRRRLLCVLGLRTSLRAAGAAALRGRYFQVKLSVSFLAALYPPPSSLVPLSCLSVAPS